MIFLTVGTHEPFDRLVRGVDDWCAATGRGAEMFGQITDHAGYRPGHFEAVASLEPAEYRRRFAMADFVISHAGMGSIITALSMQKPIVILPRRGHLRETRNDHQFATMQRFRERSGILAARDEHELADVLSRAADGEATEMQKLSQFADGQLIEALRAFIQGPAKEG
ncbi:MAG: glycosyltransferase [Jhaorihella sp.]